MAPSDGARPAASGPGGHLRSLRASPVLQAIAGATALAVSPVFVKLSGTNAGTAAFLRCALSVVILLPWTVAECRRLGVRPLRLQVLDLTAGLLLGVDLVFWAASVLEVGASIATVLLSIQVVVFPLLAWRFSGTRPSARFILTAPIMLVGVALASGAVGSREPGSQPVAGLVYGVVAGVTYAGYLYLIRRGGGQAHRIYPVTASTTSAAIAAAALGWLWTGIDPSPGWTAWGWLTAMALFGQIMAWLLLTAALPRLAPDVGAALLLLQPVLAIVFGMVIGERPTATQIGGCVVVIATLWFANRSQR